MELNCSAQLNTSDASIRLFERLAYPPLFLLAISFNITALFIFCRIKRWTDTHIYMLNLLSADFLALAFLPFRILEAFCPIKPSIFCTFLLCTQYSNMYCSIFTITAISIHRLIAVRFPFLTKALLSRSKTIACVTCFFIWMLISSISACNYRDLLPENLDHCYQLNLTRKLSHTFFLLLEVLGFFVPLLIVAFSSSQTVFILVGSLKHVEGRDRAERKKIAAVITANAFTFAVCFTPVHVGLLLQYLSDVSGRLWVHALLDVAEWMAMTNCCLDAIGYYFLLRRAHKGDKNSN